jgi:hypothetical protein
MMSCLTGGRCSPEGLLKEEQGRLSHLLEGILTGLVGATDGGPSIR